MLPPPGLSKSNPPVIETLRTAYKLWHGYHTAFPRLSRYTLGAKIDCVFHEIFISIFTARYAERHLKEQAIKDASAQLNVLIFLMQIAWELKCLDHKKYAAISPPLQAAANMIGGWQKYLKRNTTPDEQES